MINFIIRQVEKAKSTDYGLSRLIFCWSEDLFFLFIWKSLGFPYDQVAVYGATYGEAGEDEEDVACANWGGWHQHRAYQWEDEDRAPQGEEAAAKGYIDYRLGSVEPSNWTTRVLINEKEHHDHHQNAIIIAFEVKNTNH